MKRLKAKQLLLALCSGPIEAGVCAPAAGNRDVEATGGLGCAASGEGAESDRLWSPAVMALAACP